MVQSKKKIFHLITSLDVGGAEIMLLKTLPALNISFTNCVYCLKGSGEMGKKLIDAGVSVTFLNGNILKLYRETKSQKPDIFVTYLIHSDIIGRFIARLANVPVIICSVRACLRDFHYYPLVLIEQLTSPLVNNYLFNSYSVAHYYQKYFHLDSKKITVIPNGVDTEKFKPYVSRSSSRKKFKISSDSFVIGYIGRFRKQKDLETLIKSMTYSDITKSQIKFKLVLAGSGPEESRLKRIASDLGLGSKVIFLPQIDNVPKLLNALDLFILPSLFEGMSNSLLEALSAGIPVIATDIPENREIISSGKNGYLIPLHQPPALAKAILYLSTHPDIASLFGKNSCRLIKSEYSIQRTIENLKSYFLHV